ncbi:MAG: hypothetical protein RLY31_2344 [Bacteroidota bacterium]|jgi:hypothetical protein
MVLGVNDEVLVDRLEYLFEEDNLPCISVEETVLPAPMEM